MWPKKRAETFVLGLLQPSTQGRYEQAIEAFGSWLLDCSLSFCSYGEERQDFILK